MATAWYGGYEHDENSVSFNSFTREYIDAPTGVHKLLRVTADIEAKIIKPTLTEIYTAAEEMRDAYSVGGYSFEILDNNGTRIPSWYIDSTQAVGGVTVLKPVSHGEIRGSHGVNWLKCNIVLQADFLQLTPAYLSFNEVVTFSGSGRPLKVRRIPAEGDVFKQTVSEKSWYTATQTGSLSTVGTNPQPMEPIWPDLFDGTESDQTITRPGGMTVRGVPTEWSVSWSYQFSSADPFVGSAHTY